MQTVRIYRLKDLDNRTRARLKAAQIEAARVWMYCLERHQGARAERTSWPDRDDLQRETKGGKFSLQSQSIQLVCQQFLANVETIKQLRPGNLRHRFPYRHKKYRTVQWPAQAVFRRGKRLILPMGRGRKSFSFHVPDLPEHIGAASLVWRGGYELHLVVPAAPQADVSAHVEQEAQAAVDLGEIHQAAVTTSTGKGLIVTGRGIRSLKRHHNQRMRKSGIRQGQAVSPGEVCTRWHRVREPAVSEEPAVAVHDATGSKSRKEEIGPGLRCGFVGHRDIVGSMNMHPLA